MSTVCAGLDVDLLRWDGWVLGVEQLRSDTNRIFMLSPTEAKVLRALFHAQGQIVAHAELVALASPAKLKKGSGYANGARDYLITTMSSLRKLGVRIDNVKNKGYRLRSAKADPLVSLLQDMVAMGARAKKLLIITKMQNRKGKNNGRD